MCSVKRLHNSPFLKESFWFLLIYEAFSMQSLSMFVRLVPGYKRPGWNCDWVLVIVFRSWILAGRLRVRTSITHNFENAQTLLETQEAPRCFWPLEKEESNEARPTKFTRIMETNFRTPGIGDISKTRRGSGNLFTEKNAGISIRIPEKNDFRGLFNSFSILQWRRLF